MGVRSADWDLGVTLQQQLMPRASLEVAYTRRWYSGFTVTDNQATANSDWSPYSITAPARSAPARRRRLHRVGPLRRQPDQVRPGQQPDHRLEQVRRGVSVLQRPRRDVEHPAQERPHADRRHEHRTDGRRQLRGAREPARAQSGHRRRPRRLDGQHRQPVLPRRLRRPHAGARPRVVRHPEGRRCRSAACSRASRAQLLAANYAAPNSAITPSLGRRSRRQRAERDHQPARARARCTATASTSSTSASRRS